MIINQRYRAVLFNWMHDDFILEHVRGSTAHQDIKINETISPLLTSYKQARSRITKPVHSYIERMSLDIQDLEKQENNLVRRHLQAYPVYRKINKLKTDLIRIRTLIRRSNIYKQE